EIDLKQIKDGVNTIRLVRKSGEGPLYFAAKAEFFSLEEPITAAGNEIFVRRQYYKLVGRPTLLKGYIYDKVPLNDGETVTSGERIETLLTIEAKNHYEYLVFEDLKPAGLEAVQIKSGETLYAQELKQSAVQPIVGNSLNPANSNPDYTGRSRWVYQELRDRKVALFIDKLPQGVWQIRYTLRAEVPGRFHALPVLGHAMYIPEIRANGAEIRIQVSENKEK
ncbi:MAG: alpha-2-macroglobulin, partial [Nitrospinota bacterium]|nr:alpha-2-macroglobulin [Nitrospinota bacterium]